MGDNFYDLFMVCEMLVNENDEYVYDLFKVYVWDKLVL